MNKKCHILLLVGLISLTLLVLGVPSFAEDNALKIKCIDSSGAAVPDIAVSAVNMKNQKAKQGKCDSQGMVEFSGLENAPYRIFGRKEGFAPALYEFAILNGSSQSVTLSMVPGADKKLYFEDPAELKKAQASLVRGLEALKQDNVAEAEKAIAESLSINPSSAEASYYYLVLLQKQSKLDQMEQVAEKTEMLANVYLAAPPSGSNSNASAYQSIVSRTQGIIKILPALRGEKAAQDGNFDLAIKEFTEATKVEPNEPRNYQNLAIALTNAKKFDEALAVLDKAKQIQPDGFADLRKTILARKDAGSADKANVVLEEGIKLLNDDPASALKKFEEAMALAPVKQQYIVIRKIAQAQAKLNLPEALDNFKKAVELAPADKARDYKTSLALYYIGQNKMEEGVHVLEDGSANPEKDLFELALQEKDGQPALAIAALDRVLALNPNHFEAMYVLGTLYFIDEKKAKDKQSKELLTKYVASGKDAAELDNAKSMLTIIDIRARAKQKPKPKL
jgi:tetratricopeptide (TPR) repeat protein